MASTLTASSGSSDSGCSHVGGGLWCLTPEQPQGVAMQRSLGITVIPPACLAVVQMNSVHVWQALFNRCQYAVLGSTASSRANTALVNAPKCLRLA